MNKKNVEVVSCFQNVTVQEAGVKIEALVTGILIRGERVQYELTYWSGTDQKVVWVDEYFVKYAKEVTITIGFKNEKQS